MDRCPLTRPQGVREELVSQSSPMKQGDPLGKSSPGSTYPIRPVHTWPRHQHCAKVRSHLKRSPVSRASGTELPSLLSPGAGLWSWQKLVTKFFLVLVHNKSRVPKKKKKNPEVPHRGGREAQEAMGVLAQSLGHWEIPSHPSRASAKRNFNKPFSL